MKSDQFVIACALCLAIPPHAALTSDASHISTPQTIDFENFESFVTMGTNTVVPGLDFTGTPVVVQVRGSLNSIDATAVVP